MTGIGSVRSSASGSKRRTAGSSASAGWHKPSSAASLGQLDISAEGGSLQPRPAAQSARHGIQSVRGCPSSLDRGLAGGPEARRKPHHSPNASAEVKVIREVVVLQQPAGALVTKEARSAASAPCRMVAGAGMLIAQREQIEQFVGAMFRYADHSSHISARVFDQLDRGMRPFCIRGIRLDENGVAAVTEAAQRAANAPRPTVFAPPVATFREAGHARTVDLANGVAISVELDRGDTRAVACATLVSMLGPVTIAVASGGQWVGQNTGLIHDRLHLHWRLSEPTRTAEEREPLRTARYLSALLVDGDPSAAPPAHPLRWPGSWNLRRAQASHNLRRQSVRRGSPAGRAGKPSGGGREERLQLAGKPTHRRPAPGRHAHDRRGCREHPKPRRALERMGADRHGPFCASGGSQAGLAAWEAWSCKSPKHVNGTWEERWTHYAKSPPSSIGAGTISSAGQGGGRGRPHARIAPVAAPLSRGNRPAA